MSRPPISTLRVRGALTTFVTVILLALFAVIPRMVTGFGNYIASGNSIFFSFMEPVNLFWLLPKDLQFASITLPQFFDICVFALISNQFWSLLFHYYMKIKHNLLLPIEVAGQSKIDSPSRSGQIYFLSMSGPNENSTIKGLVLSSSFSDQLCGVGPSYQSLVELPRPLSTDQHYNEKFRRDIHQLSEKGLIGAFCSLSSAIHFMNHHLLANSVINYSRFDGLFLAPNAWVLEFCFIPQFSTILGGNS